MITVIVNITYIYIYIYIYNTRLYGIVYDIYIYHVYMINKYNMNFFQFDIVTLFYNLIIA